MFAFYFNLEYNIITMDISLKGANLKAYNFLLRKSDNGNTAVVVSYAELAKSIRYSTAHTFKAVRFLRENNLVETKRTGNEALQYKINK